MWQDDDVRTWYTCFSIHWSQQRTENSISCTFYLKRQRQGAWNRAGATTEITSRYIDQGCSGNMYCRKIFVGSAVRLIFAQKWGSAFDRLFMFRKVPSNCLSEYGVQMWEHTPLVRFLCHSTYLWNSSRSSWNGIMLFNLCLQISIPSLNVIIEEITRL